MPTILDILKIKPDTNYKLMEGKSLMGMIEGRDKEDRIAFCETGGLEGPYPSPYGPNIKCIRSKKWKLIYNTTTQKRELYNLEDDPDEQDNCIEKYPDISAELWGRLRDYL